MRNEYPRPDFVRERWKSLNGTWDFYEGLRARKLQIEVPFVPQSRLSGIGRNLTSDAILYERLFTVPKNGKGIGSFCISALSTINAVYGSTASAQAHIRADRLHLHMI